MKSLIRYRSLFVLITATILLFISGMALFSDADNRYGRNWDKMDEEFERGFEPTPKNDASSDQKEKDSSPN